MKSLIALIDGSIYAKSVCDHTAWIADRTGLPVQLLHVLGRRETSSATSDLSGNITLGARTALLEELSRLDEQRSRLSQQRGRAILEDAKAAIEAAGVHPVTTTLRIGDLVETVARYEAETEMVVIGKRGEAADFARLHLGSNLERVARSINRPVFVTSRSFTPIKRFLIAYDGGTSAMKAVDYVARNELFAGLGCGLLTVGPDNGETRKRLWDAQSILKGAGYSVDASTRPGQPDQVITSAVESEGIGLLVMGAYGHSRIRNLIIGSTTTEMIRSCKVPIVLFR